MRKLLLLTSLIGLLSAGCSSMYGSEGPHACSAHKDGGCQHSKDCGCSKSCGDHKSACGCGAHKGDAKEGVHCGGK